MAGAMHVRRKVPIRAFVGANGSGKTLMAVNDLTVSLDAGRPVLSAVRLLDWRADYGDPCVNPLCDVDGHGSEDHVPSHPGWVPLRRLTQLLDMQDADILLDEVGSIVSSRESTSLPHQVATLLQQLRKRQLTLTWTAPSWARADKVLREVTQLATLCNGYGARKSEGHIWRERRYVRATSYAAADLDDFEVAKVNSVVKASRPKTVCRQWARVLTMPGRLAYDTLEEVKPIGATGKGGTCIECGGRRVTPKCECGD